MAYQPFLIAPFNTGLDTDLEPWMTPLDAFTQIENGHIHHGVIEKRQGYRTFGRVVHGDAANLGITNITQASPGVVSVPSTANINNGDYVIINNVTGMTEVNGNTYIVANKAAGTFQLTNSSGNVDTSGFTAYGGGGTVYFIPSTQLAITGITQATPGVVTVASTATLTEGGIVTIDGILGMTELNGNQYKTANLTGTTFELQNLLGNNVDTSGFTAWSSLGWVYTDIGLPVMGLKRHIDPQNIKELIAFDTQRASLWDATNGYFTPLDSADIFNGDDNDFVWADNWASTASSTATTLYRMYFTNGAAFDGTHNGIRYYAGPGGTTTTSFTPLINGLTRINGCKLLFAFRQRLLLLHTFEGGNTYPQRLRWCQIQNPDAAGAWDDNVAGKGGFVDAPTGEQIISARPLQSGIIVFFTSSVWTLSPTSDPALPFRWDKINDFRACDGKMASVEYDRYVVALGIRGITATDGVETKRIDNRIEDFVTDLINLDEFEKVYTERSYANTRTWMLYPSVEGDSSNACLILDDDSAAYSIYDIDMNVLGYSNNVSSDLAAEDFTAANNLDVAANDLGGETALSFYWSGKAEMFLGGDSDGYVYILETETDDNGSNIDFSLTSSAWNPFKDQGIEAQMGYIDFFVDTDELTTLNVKFYKNNDASPYLEQNLDCLPDLNYIASISAVAIKAPATSGVRVSSPNHGLATNQAIYIYGVEGMVSLNDQAWVVTVIDEDTFDIAVDATNFSAYTGNGQIYERRFYRTKTWKRAYAGGVGYQHKISISSGGKSAPLRIHAFKPYFRQRGKRTI